jgi:hypothetical protein
MWERKELLAGEMHENAPGILPEKRGDEGILPAPDFSSVLSITQSPHGSELAALRETYNVKRIDPFMTGGGGKAYWAEWLSILGGMTEITESRHSVITALGDRFRYHRMVELPGRRVAGNILVRDGVSEESGPIGRC